MSELSDFVLDFCREHGGVVEPPAYGIYEVLLPDAVAAQLGLNSFQRFSFDDKEVAGELTRLTYGHPLVERMAELVRAAPACARFYINDVRLDKAGLAALARAALSFPNATLVEVPRALETPALFRYLRFNFKAALVSDEKREQLVSVLMDAQTGAAAPDFSALEALRVTETPAFTDMPVATAQWTSAPDPLAPEPLRALLDRAARAAMDLLAPMTLALSTRAVRLLELDHARLEAYYADLERDLERRLNRADDETRRANLEGKLSATRADHAAKLADAAAKYRLRVELDLINLGIIAQPKLMDSMRVENRQASVIRNVVWDPLRHAIEPLVCDVCFRPDFKLFLCANNHLACADHLAPQCVDCKRVYCQSCAAEITSCVVCDRPVCRRSLTRCQTCGRGTCREHLNLCHAADGQPAKAGPASQIAASPATSSAPLDAQETHSVVRARPIKPAPKPKPPAPPPTHPVVQAEYRLQVEVRTDEPLVVAFVLAKGGREVAQRLWRLTDEGIEVACYCEKGWQCPSARRMLNPEPPARIEAQLEAEISHLRAEYHIPPYRAGVYAMERGELVRLPRLRLRGLWKGKMRE